MQGLVRPVGYLALVVLAAAVVAVVVALVFDLDAVHTISVVFIGVGLALGALAFYTAPGPPAPDVPGLEREYIRHVHHADASARRAWQRDNLVLLLAGVGLVALGAAIGLLG